MAGIAFSWDQIRIRWFLEASAYTGFHQELAAVLLPDLAGGTLLDLACGLGCLDLTLAPHLKTITAVDIEPLVVQSLRERTAYVGIDNIQAVCSDIARVWEPHDYVLASFFGFSALELGLSLCRKGFVWVVNSGNEGCLYPTAHRQKKSVTVDSVTNLLNSLGLRYRLLKHTIEFGQPFASEIEARAFVRYHAPAASAVEIDSFIAEKCVPSPHFDFPLYLPNLKHIGIFYIDPNTNMSYMRNRKTLQLSKVAR